jgi:hypothetical protein
VFNTFLAICQRVEKRPSNSHSFGTQTQGFDNVRTAPNAAIEVDFKVLKHFRMMLTNFEKGKKGWR